MKRIILVSNTSWSLYNFRANVIKLLLSKGFEVICIANYDEYSERLAACGATFISSSVENRGKNPITDYRYFVFLYRLYKKLNPAFILHYTIKPNIYGSMAAKKANISSVAVVSGAGYVFLHENFLTTFTKRLYANAAKQCTEMWFINEEDQQMFVREKIVLANKTKILPGEGINTNLFRRSSPYPADNKEFIFFMSIIFSIT